MEIEIISFGRIAEFIPPQTIDLSDVTDTVELQAHLEKHYPKLAGSKYKLALNKMIVQENTGLKNMDVVAIMPPFSGG